MLIFCLNDFMIIVFITILLGAFSMSRLFGFFFPHYFSPYACLPIYLIVRGLIRLESVKIRSFKVGRPLIYFCLISGFLLGSPRSEIAVLMHRDSTKSSTPLRYKVLEMLKSFRGRHVVFVEYGKGHSFHKEWVYNAVDIDAQDIVWCRNLPEIERRAVKDYYPDRVFWIAKVNNSKVQVQLEDPASNQLSSDGLRQGLPASWSLEQD